MPQISLACYSVRIREQNARSSLDFSDAKIKNLHQFFENYFQGRQKKWNNDTENKKVLSVREYSNTATEISGILTTGAYGFESELHDVSGKKERYKRAKEQADMLPFYFHLYLPAKGNCGILILQRFGLFGVRSILTRDLNEHFKIKFPDLTLNIWPQVPDGVLEIIMQGGLQKIILRKMTLPPDICDVLDDDDADAQSGTLDLVITGKSGFKFQSTLKKFRDMINRRSPLRLSEVVEVDGFKPDKILIQVDLEGRTKRIDLTNLNRLRANVDITKDVSYGEDGHPTLRSLQAETKDLLQSLRQTLDI